MVLTERAIAATKTDGKECKNAGAAEWDGKEMRENARAMMLTGFDGKGSEI